jgi:hypothetical protein
MKKSHTSTSVTRTEIGTVWLLSSAGQRYRAIEYTDFQGTTNVRSTLREWAEGAKSYQLEDGTLAREDCDGKIRIDGSGVELTKVGSIHNAH